MTSSTKASSAGSTSGQGSRLGSIRRGALATRGASAEGDGSGAPTYGRRLLLTLALATASLLALTFASSASAVVVFPSLGEIYGPAPATHFSFLYSESVAVNDSNGHILVADSGRVYDFTDASDTTPDTWDGSATPAGSFGGGRVAVAVDNSSGDVYVADATHAVIDKFDASGTLIAAFGTGGELSGSATPVGSNTGGNPFAPAAVGTFGIAVDQATHDLYVLDAGHQATDVFNSSGAYQSQINDPAAVTVGLYGCGGAYADGIAVNPTSGHVFVSDSCPPQAFEFDSAGNFVQAITGSNTPAGSFGNGYASLALDNSSGDLYVTETGDQVTDQFDSAGNYLAQITATPGGNSGGVSIDQASGDVYVSDNGSRSVKIFAGAPVAVPDLITNAAAAIAKHSATLNGHLDPAGGGDITDCHFQYTDDATFKAQGYTGAQTIACDQPTPISSPSDVTAAPTGLNPDTTYHFRLVAANANGPNQGADQTFTTIPAVDLTINPADPVAATAVTVHGHLDSNGGGDITDCHFDFADDASFQANGFSAAQSVPCVPATPISAPADVSADISGLTAQTTYHVRLVATNGDGTAKTADQTFTTIPAVGLTINPADPIGSGTATLNGHVDSLVGGDISDCHFEYADDQTFGAHGFSGAQSAPCTPATPISAATDVSADISGLAPDTTYHVRLVATNGDGSTTTDDLPFTTLPVPVIASASASNLTTTEADLNATINPKGSATTYHFDYGTDTSYGASTPTAGIGSGTSPVVVTRHITGLTPNTTYHFRLVATSANGTTVGADHTFLYATTGQGLPDNRAYEMVTPVHKNGGVIGSVILGRSPDVSESGSRVVAPAIQCFGDAQSCVANRQQEGEPVAFERTPTGWRDTTYAPPATLPGAASVWSFSADVGTAIFSRPSPPGNQDEWLFRNPDGSFTDLGPITQPALGGTGTTGYDPPSETADGSRIYWDARRPNGFWPADQTTGAFSLYEYAHATSSGGDPLLVAVGGPNDGPGSTDLISLCGATLGIDSPIEQFPGAISADGRTAFFTAQRLSNGQPCPGGSGANAATPVPADALYARIDNDLPSAHTVPISERSPGDCTTPACTTSAPRDAQFRGAAADGTRAYFLSTQQLTDDASQDPDPGDSAIQTGCPQLAGANGCNLYLYDFAKPAGHELTAVSAGDSSGGGPQVLGVAAVSADGSHVYFVANGVLAAGASPGDCRPGGTGGSIGACNLYVYDAATGATSFIARLPGSDDEAPNQRFWTDGPHLANVSPDGRYLVFQSRARLTADEPSATGAEQIFRYDAQAGDLRRISIGSHGFGDNGNAAIGDATIVPAIDFLLRVGPARNDPTMSHDGARVFFMSPAALTPHALDDVPVGTQGSLAQNLYEWERAGAGSCPASQSEGCVYLISDGRDTTATTGNSSVRLLGTDASGDNVFFRTTDQLVPQDPDTIADYYDARVGGGIPFTPPPPPCQGDACTGAGTTAPSTTGAGSAVFNGPGNPKPHRSPHKKHHHKKHRHHKRHHARANSNRGGQK